MTLMCFVVRQFTLAHCNTNFTKKHEQTNRKALHQAPSVLQISRTIQMAELTTLNDEGSCHSMPSTASGTFSSAKPNPLRPHGYSFSFV